MGLFGKEMFEVTAAIDDNVVVPSSSRGGRTIPFERYLDNSAGRETGSIAVSELRKMAEGFEGKRREGHILAGQRVAVALIARGGGAAGSPVVDRRGSGLAAVTRRLVGCGPTLGPPRIGWMTLGS